MIRAATALALPFVTEVWEVYVLIAVLQSASAAFTPTFQSTIPETLPNEDDYTKALSLSRLAYDLENLISPALAALILLATSWQALFSGTVIGFIASALLVVSVALPSGAKSEKRRGVYDRARAGFRIFMATPRLRGVMSLNLVVSLAGAMVIVNTVVLVQGQFGLTDQHTAMAFAAFGGGSMLAALALPALLKRWQDRQVMLTGGGILVAGLVLALPVGSLEWLLPVWAWLGVGFSTVQTPIGRVLTRSSHAEDRPALFAAQFSLSHAGWLIAYPLAGWLGSSAGMTITLLILLGFALGGLILAVKLWPSVDPSERSHHHDDLPSDPLISQVISTPVSTVTTTSLIACIPNGQIEFCSHRLENFNGRHLWNGGNAGAFLRQLGGIKSRNLGCCERSLLFRTLGSLRSQSERLDLA